MAEQEERAAGVPFAFASPPLVVPELVYNRPEFKGAQMAREELSRGAMVLWAGFRGLPEEPLIAHSAARRSEAQPQRAHRADR